MVNRIKILTVLLLGICLSVYSFALYWNHQELQKPTSQIIAEDSRNNGLLVRAHYDRLLNKSKIIINYEQVLPPAEAPDIFRSFVQISKKLSKHKPDQVLIQVRGNSKAILDGESFHALGQKYGQEKTIELAKFFAANLRHLNGDYIISKQGGHVASLLKGKYRQDDSTHRDEVLDMLLQDTSSEQQ